MHVQIIYSVKLCRQRNKGLPLAEHGIVDQISRFVGAAEGVVHGLVPDGEG